MLHVHSSGSTGSDDLDPEDPDFPGLGKHNLVKSKEHEGECLKCGLLGSWSWIKSQICQPKPKPTHEVPAQPVPTITSSGSDAAPADPSLAEELEKALKAGDNEAASEIMTLMELEHQHESLGDEELALKILEEELAVLELEESLQQLDLQCHAFDEEQEQIQTFYAMEESRKETEAVMRPPASPLTSKTPIPCVKKPIAKEPAICS